MEKKSALSERFINIEFLQNRRMNLSDNADFFSIYQYGSLPGTMQSGIFSRDINGFDTQFPKESLDNSLGIVEIRLPTFTMPGTYRIDPGNQAAKHFAFFRQVVLPRNIHLPGFEYPDTAVFISPVRFKSGQQVHPQAWPHIFLVGRHRVRYPDRSEERRVGKECRSR